MCQHNCGSTVQKALAKVEGVLDAKVSFSNRSASVKVIPAGVGVSALIDVVESVGFDAFEWKDDDSRRSDNDHGNSATTSETFHNHERKFCNMQDSDADAISFVYSVENVSCASCVSKIEKALQQLPKVDDCAVNLLTGQIKIVVGRSASFSPLDVEGILCGMGYPTRLLDEEEDRYELLKRAREKEVSQWLQTLKVCLLFAVPTAALHMVLMNIPATSDWLHTPIDNSEEYDDVTSGMHHEEESGTRVPTVGAVVLWVLATPVQFGPGWRFFKGAWKGLRHGNLGMDFLIAFGTGTAYLYSVMSVILSAVISDFHGKHFFETSTMLITFVVFGKYLECVAKGKTSDALSKLMGMQVKSAIRVHFSLDDKDKVVKEEEVDLTHIQIGDVVKVIPGAKIPTDGTVIKGESYIDESMLTGESIPMAKASGDDVFGATVNQFGVLLVRVTRVGKDTTLAQIVKLVEEAQTSKAPIQSFADFVSSIFVPFVILFAVVTFLTWFLLCGFGKIPAHWKDEQSGDSFLFSFLFSVSVVVIACPCALGLATPTAVMVGTGVGAENGILIKGGHALEIAHKVSAIMLDKTGTLTEGRPSVTDIELSDGSRASVQSSRELLTIAALAELNSEHPLGKAIVDGWNTRYLGKNAPCNDGAFSCSELDVNIVENFEITPGSGLSCLVDGFDVKVGKLSWLSNEHGMNIHAKTVASVRNLRKQGKTVVGVTLDNEFQGIVALCDAIKEDSVATVSALHAMGVEVWMATGDNEVTAKTVAQQVGIHNVLAEISPAGKADKCTELQKEGHTVAMVGDGINDAIALAKADAGIAIGAGTEIATEAADIVLVKDSIFDVCIAIDLSRVVFQRIKINFVWALAYNCIGIPLAAGALYPPLQLRLPPMFAGLAMVFSSISVVISSLMLKHYQRPSKFNTKVKSSIQKQEIELTPMSAEAINTATV